LDQGMDNEERSK
jgi:hypothetical protein